MDIKKLVNLEIEEELNKLNEKTETGVGSEEHRTAVDSVTKLLDRSIEIYRIDKEAEEKAEIRKQEFELKLKQLEEEKKDHLIKNCLTAAGIIIPTVVTIWGTVKSIKFEETGTITTIMGRGFIQKLLPKK